MNGETSRNSGPFPPTVVRIWFTLQSSHVYSADWLAFARDPLGAGCASEERTFTPEDLGRLELTWKPQVNSERRFLAGLRVPVVGSRLDAPSGGQLSSMLPSFHNVHALDANDGSVMENVLSTTISVEDSDNEALSNLGGMSISVDFLHPDFSVGAKL